MLPPRVALTSVSFSIVAFVVVLTFIQTAIAQQPDPDAQVRQGMALREQNQPDAAIEHFRRVWDRTHYPRALAQIAVTEQTLGRWAEADRHFREVLAITDHVWVQQNRALIQDSLNTIAEHLGELEVLGAPPGAELWVNDQRVAVTPLDAPLRLAIGTTVIELRATGFVPWRRAVTLASRQLTRETAVMVRTGETPVATDAGTDDVSPPPPPPVVVMRDPGATQRVLGWTSLGLAAVGAGVGVGGVFVRDGLEHPSALTDQVASQLTDAGILLGAGFGAAGAFAVSGLVLLFTARVVRVPSVTGRGELHAALLSMRLALHRALTTYEHPPRSHGVRDRPAIR
jgi:hypothetical protein